jgi:nicotinate dehydrogenase subunit A
MATFQFRLNGTPRTLQIDDPDTPLLYVLRNDCDLPGTHFGCGLAQCGACTVHVDGRAVRSCSTPVIAVHGKAVTTIEGLGTPDKPDPLQAAFIAEQAAQCGYCTAGIVMSARALLDQNPKPTEAQAREALAGNLCRCGSHARVLRAIMRVAGAKP